MRIVLKGARYSYSHTNDFCEDESTVRSQPKGRTCMVYLPTCTFSCFFQGSMYVNIPNPNHFEIAAGTWNINDLVVIKIMNLPPSMVNLNHLPMFRVLNPDWFQHQEGTCEPTHSHPCGKSCCDFAKKIPMQIEFLKEISHGNSMYLQPSKSPKHRWEFYPRNLLMLGPMEIFSDCLHTWWNSSIPFRQFRRGKNIWRPVTSAWFAEKHTFLKISVM